MATQVQRRRGTTAQHAAFSGQLAETTIDTDKMTVVVQDGTTLGGHPLATEANLTAHITDAADAHDASAISILDIGGNFTATDVEGALAELAAPSGGLTYFTEARSTTVPNATVPAHSFTATGAETNIDAVLSPKGTGAILTGVPDAAATGGNKRGSKAVDLQLARTSASNVASGDYSALSGGNTNTVSGYAGTISGGWVNSVSGMFSTIPGGAFATDRGLTGRLSFAAGVHTTLGDAQIGTQVIKRQTADATAAVLFAASDAAPSSTTVAVLPDNHSYTVSALVTARDVTTGDTASWKVEGVIKRGANAAATALVGTPTVTSLGADASLATAAVALIADTTLGAAEIQVTGIAATTIRWVCKMDTVEVG